MLLKTKPVHTWGWSYCLRLANPDIQILNRTVFGGLILHNFIDQGQQEKDYNVI